MDIANLGGVIQLQIADCRLQIFGLITLVLLSAGVAEFAHAEQTSIKQVRNSAELSQALTSAQPGTTILLAPGEYTGDLHFRDIMGEPGKPIVIAAEDPDQPSVIKGRKQCLHLSGAAYVELHNLTFTGAAANGLNIDDGGSYDTPTHHVILKGLTVTDIGSAGNHDGIKLSGVDDFRIEGCSVSHWGRRGQGIDMVGCHNGVIEGCVLRHQDDGGAGVQTKGGSTNIQIRRCRFEHAGARAVNIGGSTGLQYFRPPLVNGASHAEAREILVEGCTFIGSQAPIAFVGVDGAIVRFNTIYRPKRWVTRILQETRVEGFVPSQRGAFTDNIVAFRSDELASTVNVGPATASQTFSFARNWWYCLDRPVESTPALPTTETDGVVGVDPRFRDMEGEDLAVQLESPARRVGADACCDNPNPVETTQF